jgi:diphthamide synthase (EF-2-diphthine--ammonia ligase)
LTRDRINRIFSDLEEPLLKGALTLHQIQQLCIRSSAHTTERVTHQDLILSWSGGKDSVMSAYELRCSQKYEIAALLTTVTADDERISMHGVRRELLERQAESLGFRLHNVFIPKDCCNEIYQHRMGSAFNHFKARGITKIAFGDLFLEDIKNYRDRQLALQGMSAIYPIWNCDTTANIIPSYTMDLSSINLLAVARERERCAPADSTTVTSCQHE